MRTGKFQMSFFLDCLVFDAKEIGLVWLRTTVGHVTLRPTKMAVGDSLKVPPNNITAKLHMVNPKKIFLSSL